MARRNPLDDEIRRMVRAMNEAPSSHGEDTWRSLFLRAKRAGVGIVVESAFSGAKYPADDAIYDPRFGRVLLAWRGQPTMALDNVLSVSTDDGRVKLTHPGGWPLQRNPLPSSEVDRILAPGYVSTPCGVLPASAVQVKGAIRAGAFDMVQTRHGMIPQVSRFRAAPGRAGEVARKCKVSRGAAARIDAVEEPIGFRAEAIPGLLESLPPEMRKRWRGRKVTHLYGPEGMERARGRRASNPIDFGTALVEGVTAGLGFGIAGGIIDTVTGRRRANPKGYDFPIWKPGDVVQPTYRPIPGPGPGMPPLALDARAVVVRVQYYGKSGREVAKPTAGGDARILVRGIEEGYPSNGVEYWTYSDAIGHATKQGNPSRPRPRLSWDVQRFLAEKVPLLVAEGYPRKQAVAIAFDMARRAGLSVPAAPKRRRNNPGIKKGDSYEYFGQIWQVLRVSKAGIDMARPVADAFGKVDFIDHRTFQERDLAKMRKQNPGLAPLIMVGNAPDTNPGILTRVKRFFSGAKENKSGNRRHGTKPPPIKLPPERFLGKISVKEAIRRGIPGVKEAAARFRKFHGCEPPDELVGYDDGMNVAGFLIGRTPEVTYADVPEGSNKSGSEWFHKISTKTPSYIVHVPFNESMHIIGDMPSHGVRDWLREKGERRRH